MPGTCTLCPPTKGVTVILSPNTESQLKVIQGLFELPSENKDSSRMQPITLDKHRASAFIRFHGGFTHEAHQLLEHLATEFRYGISRVIDPAYEKDVHPPVEAISYIVYPQ